MRPDYMRLVMGVIVAAVCLASGGAEAARPDFTGTWRIVVDRSSGVTPDRLDTWIVTQDANTLTLVDANFPADHRAYKLDGTPTAISNAIGEWVYRATWT